MYSTKVRLSIPEGAPLCIFRLAINVKANGANYMTTSMDVETK